MIKILLWEFILVKVQKSDMIKKNIIAHKI